VVLVGAAAVAGVSAAFLLGLAGGGASDQPTTPTVAPVQAAPAGSRQVLPARDPFEIDGARWAVFGNPGQAWVTSASHLAPAAGHRWQFVEVLVRNLGRPRFLPCALHYRLEDSARVTYFRDRRVGPGIQAGQPPAPLPAGRQTQCRLAFQVPAGASGLRLVFDPLTTPGRYEIPL
jgi:hypothetical protein